MYGWILVSLVILLILLAWFLLLRDLFFDKREKKKHSKKVYRVLKYYADEQDHLLLNNVALYIPSAEKNPVYYDHILFADKYIYVFMDVAFQGGIYGNIQDALLFRKGYKEKANNVINPVLENEKKVQQLEELMSLQHSDKMLVSVVVYNSKMIVPTTLSKKEQNSWFLSIDELEKTLKTAEKDDVTSISHETSKAMLDSLLEKSEMIKREVANQKKRK